MPTIRKSRKKPQAFTSQIFGSKWFILCKAVGLEICSIVSNPYRARGREPRKVVISQSLVIALIRSLIHVLPVVVTVVLAYFNLTGYFLGGTVNGGARITQGGALLMLQIAAKLMELCIIASLTTIITGVIRHQALFGTGIPLGIFGAGTRVSQLSYLWSPAYICGGAGIQGRIKRTLIMLMIALATLISLFAGPSSALLLIPSFTDGWNAGGSDFWLVGTPDTLWPDRLEARHAGGASCLNASPEIVITAPLNSSSCVWQGHTQLAEALKDRRFDWQSNITINDGVVKRQLSRQQTGATGVETWVLGVHLSAARLSRLLADEWVTATQWSKAARGPGRLAKYKKAASGQGRAIVKSWIPVVRTACERFGSILHVPSIQTNENSPGTLADTSGRTVIVPFPRLPEYRATTYSGPTIDYSEHENLTVFIHSGTHMSTQWLRPPTGNQESTEWASNSYLALVIPFTEHSNEDGHDMSPAIMACTVDARWALGEVIGGGLPLPDNMLQYGQIGHQRTPSVGSELDNRPNAFLPTPGPFWRTVAMSSDWLDALTPILSPDKFGWTSLSYSFTNAGLDNSTGLVLDNYATVGSTVESELASAIVDGMSRIGLEQNGGNMQHVSDRYKWLNLPWDAKEKEGLLLELLRGRAVLDLPKGETAESATRLRWSVTISGYAYRANGVPYYLALAVLLSHSLIAFLHVFTLICTRRSSSAWESLEEIMVLCHRSKPNLNEKLRNTCAGIQCPSTMRQLVKIVSLDDIDAEDEEIQLQLLPSPENQNSNSSRTIQVNQAYGTSENREVFHDAQVADNVSLVDIPQPQHQQRSSDEDQVSNESEQREASSHPN